jgi:glycosyltransferase involved in cell wall biosynthesis
MQVIAVRVAGSPVIVEFHAFDLSAKASQAGGRLRAVMWVLGRLSRRLVALHEHDASALRALAPGADVTVLPNWVDVPDLGRVLPDAEPWRAVFVGGLTKRKGVSLLLEAMRLLGEERVHLRIVGGAGDDGPEAAEQIRRSAEDLVQSGRVEFLGELGREEVRQVLAASHLFVLPSEAEGTPMAMLEALAESCPVLVSDVGSMGSITRDMRCGAVLPSREPAAIAEGMRGILRNPREWATASVAAHRAALDHFSHHAVSTRLESILAS